MANSDHYRQLMRQYEEDIAKLQAEVEKAREGRSALLAIFGKGELAKAKKTLAERDKEVAALQAKLAKAEADHAPRRHRLRRLRVGTPLARPRPPLAQTPLTT